jgi:hypothetical protein
MGETRSLQPIITVKGTKAGGAVVQPVRGWGNAGNYTDGVFHVQILAQDGGGGQYPKLAIESAASPAGPWAEIVSWDRVAAPPINEVVGASTSAPGYSGSTKYLERFFRWKIDVSALASGTDEWAMCFGICVTLK